MSIVRYVFLSMFLSLLLQVPLHSGQTRHAYFMQLPDNWEIKGELPTQAFLISLQGLANDGAPRLYFSYPKNWPYGYTKSLKE